MLFLGRFHPLLVHFPIALLLVAFLFETLSRTRRFAGLKDAVLPLLSLGAISAVLSALSGYWLSLEGGYEETALRNHLYTGVATACFAVIVAIVKWKTAPFAQASVRRLNIILFAVLSILLTAAGHLGAGLTHGEAFLTEHAPWNDSDDGDGDWVPVVENIDEAVYYDDVIQPILARKCYGCHSAKRQKGDLRMDTQAFLVQGGKSGSLLAGSLTDSTLLCKRIMLPEDHEEHMPPNEREQLSSAEIALIQTWVADGAAFDRPVKQMSNAIAVRSVWKTFEQASVLKSMIPDDPVDAAPSHLLEALRGQGLLVIPVSETSNYLRIRVPSDSLNADVFPNLLALKQQIIELNMTNAKIGDRDMQTIAGLDNLRRLDVSHTGVGDEGVKALKQMPNLRYLNLVGTGISDATLETLGDMSPLKQVFIFQTALSAARVRAFAEQHAAIEIDTGNYFLPPRVTDTLVYTRKP